MRTAFIKTLLELTAADPRIMLLTGDLAMACWKPFAKDRPKQFYQPVVAEQT